jgi:hypothetical protein
LLGCITSLFDILLSCIAEQDLEQDSAFVLAQVDRLQEAVEEEKQLCTEREEHCRDEVEHLRGDVEVCRVGPAAA